MPDYSFALRAFRARNYRLFFAGQSVSLLGTWMTRIASSWLMYRLTNSALLLGLAGFVGQIPVFLLSPFVGVWIDRWDRHRVLVIAQAASMIQSLALAWLTLSGVITPWEIIWLALLQGIINAVEMPARQSFVVQMVEAKEDLGNAIALNSSMVNATRLIGPAIGGIVTAAVGEGWCFLIDGVSYIAVIASLLWMRITVVQVRNSRREMKHEMAEGWHYASRSVPIRAILLNLAMASFAGMPYMTLMPIFASQVLKGDAHTLGFLMAATGVGALIGSVQLALRRSVIGLGSRIVITTILYGASMAAFGLSHNYWLSLLVLPLTGFGMMQQMASSNTILQTIVDDEKRGRVMSFYSMAFQGMTPFGSLFAGELAARIGAPWTVFISGVLCVAAGAWFGFSLKSIREAIRPIYRRLGILPTPVPDAPAPNY